MKKLIFILFPVFSYGQISINKTFQTASTVTSDVLSFGIADKVYTAGKLYIVFAAATGADNPIVCNGTTLTWTTVLNYGDATRRIGVYRCIPGSTTAGTEDILMNGWTGSCTGFSFAVWEVTGADATTPIQQLNSDSQTGADPSITLSALQSSRSAVVSFFFNDANPFGGTPESGWTEDFDNGYSTPTAGTYLMSRTTTTDNTPTVTASSSTWIGMAFEIKAAGRRAVIIN